MIIRYLGPWGKLCKQQCKRPLQSAIPARDLFWRTERSLLDGEEPSQ